MLRRKRSLVYFTLLKVITKWSDLLFHLTVGKICPFYEKGLIQFESMV